MFLLITTFIIFSVSNAVAKYPGMEHGHPSAYTNVLGEHGGETFHRKPLLTIY